MEAFRQLRYLQVSFFFLLQYVSTYMKIYSNKQLTSTGAFLHCRYMLWKVPFNTIFLYSLKIKTISNCTYHYDIRNENITTTV